MMYRFILVIFLLSVTHRGFCESHEKWIVITTIQHPTQSLKELCVRAEREGWKIVVVADKKTPGDWSLKNCIFLSIEDQKNLGYEILKWLPWNHYCRKNIGYLYAIEHGAKLIYETDDDNAVLETLSTIPNEGPINFLESNTSVVNVYAYFGQPNVWPRGLPLEQIAYASQYRVTPSAKVSIGIEQGLVNKDPDVDAIFRLTQEREIYFKRKLPCVLAKGVFCPFNTQNTLFHYEAFWGLLIPSTTSFRVCDIWRGLITQRLLWEIGFLLCFRSPTALQERNAHNYHNDFEDELQLYLNSGKLIALLSRWQRTSNQFEESCLSLYRDLVKENFLLDDDLHLHIAWIRDLKKVGYQFPELSMVE